MQKLPAPRLPGKRDTSAIRLRQELNPQPVAQELPTETELLARAEREADEQIKQLEEQARAKAKTEARTRAADEEEARIEAAGADRWYYLQQSEPVGPVSLEEIMERISDLTMPLPVNLVWTEGMEEWKPVYEVRKLCQPSPPVIRSFHQDQARVTTEAIRIEYEPQQAPEVEVITRGELSPAEQEAVIFKAAVKERAAQDKKLRSAAEALVAEDAKIAAVARVLAELDAETEPEVETRASRHAAEEAITVQRAKLIAEALQARADEALRLHAEAEAKVTEETHKRLAAEAFAAEQAKVAAAVIARAEAEAAAGALAQQVRLAAEAEAMAAEETRIRIAAEAQAVAATQIATAAAQAKADEELRTQLLQRAAEDAAAAQQAILAAQAAQARAVEAANLQAAAEAKVAAEISMRVAAEARAIEQTRIADAATARAKAEEEARIQVEKQVQQQAAREQEAAQLAAAAQAQAAEAAELQAAAASKVAEETAIRIAAEEAGIAAAAVAREKAEEESRILAREHAEHAAKVSEEAAAAKVALEARIRIATEARIADQARVAVAASAREKAVEESRIQAQELAAKQALAATAMVAAEAQAAEEAKIAAAASAHEKLAAASRIQAQQRAAQQVRITAEANAARAAAASAVTLAAEARAENEARIRLAGAAKLKAIAMAQTATTQEPVAKRSISTALPFLGTQLVAAAGNLAEAAVPTGKNVKPAKRDSKRIWFYSCKGERNGPTTFEELQALVAGSTLNPRLDMVWKQGMKAWSPAGEIAGLFERKIPPVITREAHVSPVPIAGLRDQSIRGELGPNTMWRGARRRSLWFGVLVFPFIWHFGLAAAEPFLVKQFGKLMMAEILPFAPLVPSLVVVYLGLRRLLNLGMSQLWAIAWLIPGVNLWVAYRCLVCPAGYAYHKKLDRTGVALAIVGGSILLSLGMAVGASVALLSDPDALAGPWKSLQEIVRNLSTSFK